MKLQFSWQIFEKSADVKFHENPSNGSRVAPCGRTDMTKLIVAFRDFANAPKKSFTDFRKNITYLRVGVLGICQVLSVSCKTVSLAYDKLLFHERHTHTHTYICPISVMLVWVSVSFRSIVNISDHRTPVLLKMTQCGLEGRGAIP